MALFLPSSLQSQEPCLHNLLYILTTPGRYRFTFPTTLLSLSSFLFNSSFRSSLLQINQINRIYLSKRLLNKAPAVSIVPNMAKMNQAKSY